MKRLRQVLSSLLLLAIATAMWGSDRPPVTATPVPCDPPIAEVVFGEHQDPQVETALADLLEADHADRVWGQIDLQVMLANDRHRREVAMAYLENGQVVSGPALYATAFLFHHGNCLEHYQLASTLAEQAIAEGEQAAKQLYAQTIDRYLMDQGLPQRYGTQYYPVGNRFVMWPIDPATTDEERSRYNVAPPSETLKFANCMLQNRTDCF